MSRIHVTTKVNGDEIDFLCEPDETLLDALRNRLGLTGSKEGCGTGDCGACSVTLDGRLVCSCLVLAADGYPGGYPKGMAIEGPAVTPIDSDDLQVFHAGTDLAGEDGHLVTTGGRVLGVTALGRTLDEARARAYDHAEEIHFEGKIHRGDIGVPPR